MSHKVIDFFVLVCKCFVKIPVLINDLCIADFFDHHSYYYTVYGVFTCQIQKQALSLSENGMAG